MALEVPGSFLEPAPDVVAIYSEGVEAADRTGKAMTGHPQLADALEDPCSLRCSPGHRADACILMLPSFRTI